MPPTSSKVTKAKQKPQEDQREETLQAVVSGCVLHKPNNYIDPIS